MAKTKKDKKSKATKKVKENKKPLTPQEIDVLIEPLEEWCRQATLFHLSEVKKQAGEILTEDVDYCIKLTKRMVNFKKANIN